MSNKFSFKNGVLFLFATFLCFFSCSTTTPTLINNNTHPDVPNLRGVNVVAGEVAWKGENVPVVSGTHYQFLKPADIDYLVSKKINFIRLVISWEYLQPNLNTDFPDTEYNRKLTETVEYATSRGLFVLVEPHGAADANFWRYKGNPIGSSAVPITAFADFWKRMAWKFGNNWRVSYGLGNEPHSMDTATVYQAQQAAIDAIRKTTSRQMIFAELNHFSHIYTLNEKWTDASGKMTNAQGMLTLKDPLNNLVFEIHEYFGVPGGTGSNSTIESETIMVERLKIGVQFARQHGLKLHLGEFAADSSNPMAPKAVKNVLEYINQNTDIIIGWSWWAAGDYNWWKNDRFSLLTTKNNSPDDIKWSWLSPYLAGLTTVSPTLPLPPVVIDAGIVDVGKDADPVIKDSGTVLLDSGVDAGVNNQLLVFKTRITADALAFYCVEFDIQNPTSQEESWTIARVDMLDSIMQNKKFVNAPWDSWNVMPSARNGIVEMVAAKWNQKIPPKSKKVFGFCADKGPSKAIAKLIELK